MAGAKKTTKAAKSKKRVAVAVESGASKAENTQIIEDAIVLDRVAPTAKSQAEPPAATSGGLVPLVIGGLIAGALGFGAASLLNTGATPVDNSATEQLAAQTAQLAEQAALLQAELAELRRSAADGATEAALGDLDSRLEQMATLGAARSNAWGGLADRITELENRARLPEKPNEDAAALIAELTVLRDAVLQTLSRLETAQAALAAAQDDTAMASDDAVARNALAAVMQALDSGGPFATLLENLADAGVEIPEALTQAAQHGVTTLISLRARFPDAARAALNAASRARADAGETSKLGAFLRTQLGVRSLQPRQGDGTDAILSRAEAALRRDDITTALAEIDGLPQVGVAAMADWADLARRRQIVVDAAAVLSAAMGK